MKKNIIMILFAISFFGMISSGCAVNASKDCAVNTPRSSLNLNEKLLPKQNSEVRKDNITHVVIHFSSNAYNNQQNPYNIDDVYSIFKDNKVSSHYLIDRDGKVYIFVPENRVAYHAGKGKLKEYPEYENKLNHYSIGIELLGIGKKEEMIPIIGLQKFNSIDPELLGFTKKQYDSLNLLLDDVLSRNKNIKKDRKHIIGHSEYNPNKTDPGDLFDWSEIGL